VRAERRTALRVLHVFGAMDRGGAETRTLELMRQLDRAEVTFDFCVLSGRPGVYANEIATLGGRVIPCVVPRQLGQLPGLLRTGAWDVVHSHVHHFSGVVLLAARIAGIRRRVAHLRTSHTGAPQSRRRRLYEAAMRRLIDATATTVLGVSEAAMASFYGAAWRADDRRIVLYNGIDVARFATPVDRAGVRAALGVAPTEHLLLHVGNFHPAKNHTGLIAMAARLAAEQVPFVLALVGDGPARSDIEAMVHTEGLAHCVRFLGARDDVATLLAAADCFVFPSRWEGLPGAVLEALAAGVPVVGSAIPPVEEIARQTTGVACVDPDDVPGFAARIVRHLAERPPATLPPQFTTAVALEGLLGCYA
jgi:glycosyltransferase involved in cell wall biosynthesis